MNVEEIRMEQNGPEESEVGSMANRTRIRDQLNADIEAFLQQGGAIVRVENDVRADPPKKPDANYGSLPI